MSKLDKRAISILVIAILALSFVLPLVTVSAADGSGSCVVSPTSVVATSTDNELTFVFTAVETMDGGAISIEMPVGWSAPQGVVATAGYTTVTGTDIGTPTFVLQVVTVPITTLPSGGTITVVYGDITGGGAGSGATAQSTAGIAIFVTKSMLAPGVGGVILTPLAAGNPTVTVLPNTGTLSIDTTGAAGGVYVDGDYWGIASQSQVVDVGTYTVSFGAVSGFTTPAPQIATVNYGLTTVVTGIYGSVPPGFSIDSVSAVIVDYAKVLKVTGSGVTAGTEVNIFWDYAYGTYAHLLNTTEGKPDATFECDVEVPSDVEGFHFLWATDTATGETVSFGPLTMVPKIKLSPSSGLVGDEITVTGYGFAAEEDVILTFNITATAPYEPTELGTVETDELGYFTLKFNIPQSDYNEFHTVHANTVWDYFTVGASISLTPDEGPTGTVVTVDGRGWTGGYTMSFAIGTTVRIVEGEDPVIKTDGTFSIDVVIPNVGSVTEYSITASETGPVGDPVVGPAYADFDVTGLPEIVVSPTYGSPGATISITGSNFTQIAGLDVTVTLDTPTPTELVIAETNSDGTFEDTFISPAVAFVGYKVKAVDAYSIIAEDSFKVGLIALIINPTHGSAGTKVAITGIGFASDPNPLYYGDFNMTFGEKLYEYKDGVVSEAISKYFYVPNVELGTYDVTVIDEDENELTAQFTVTAVTEVELDPAMAPIDYNVTIEGHNFAKCAEPVDFVLYNATDEWEMDVTYNEAAVKTDTDGNFTGHWKILTELELSLGDYTINITGYDDFLIQVPFSVVEARVSVAPRKALFDRGDTIQFNVKNDFKFINSYMKIWDPYDNLYWQTETFENWLKVGDLHTVPYYLQTSGMNPMTLSQDAPLGPWFYAFYTVEDKELINGTFSVGPSSAAQVEEKLTEIWASMEDLSTDIDSITDELAGDIDALSGDIDDVVADVQDMIDDITADLAEELAGVAEDTEAAVDALEGSIGDIAAAQNALQSDIDDMGQDTAAAKQAAEDAQEGTQGLTTLVYGAIAASLIAALAAVVSLMQISKKIA